MSNQSNDPPHILGEGQAQRWRRRRDVFVPPESRFDPTRHGVEPIEVDTVARDFVVEHHYSRSFPAARARFGLYEVSDCGERALVGVAVFSVPMQ
jgi:hypothetical protein